MKQLMLMIGTRKGAFLAFSDPCPYQKLGTCCGRCSYAPRLIRSVAA